MTPDHPVLRAQSMQTILYYETLNSSKASLFPEVSWN